MREARTVLCCHDEQLETIAIVDRVLVVQVQLLLPTIESFDAVERLRRVVELDVVREAVAVWQ